MHTIGNCILVRVTPNNPQLHFLCIPVCAAGWSDLSHIPSDFCNYPWVKQPSLLSIQSTLMLAGTTAMSSQVYSHPWFRCSLAKQRGATVSLLGLFPASGLTLSW